MKPMLFSNRIKKFDRAAEHAAKNTVLLKLLLILVSVSVSISSNGQKSAGVKVDVTGNWQITITVSADTIKGKGSLTQTGDVVTGWVGPNENDPISITGMFKKGKLIIKTLPQPGRTVAFDQLELTVSVDTLSGAIENGSRGKGSIKFIRSK